ncbi:hypothetical protein GCM10011521_27020 [Arenimonas soli]|uniref:Lipoprotein n=1 Tax=Arenimonas soli TaxID=2269504 RepID=A0ABQ1HSQ1_9GAMM|nr:hypothetical protein [Arenimonas soli]GGA87187.1 hypothetical protein GCM10011521_27020 [Arenimonas soli]
MNRPLTAALAAFVLAGCATVPDRQSAADTTAEAPKRAFIERSLVVAPESLGEFRLAGMDDFPDQPQAGVALQFNHPDFPDVVISLFVYPVGRVDRETALEQGMEQFRRELAMLSAQGHYADVAYGDETAFDLDAVAQDGQAVVPDLPPEVPETDKPASSEERFLALVAEIEPGMDTTLGRRLPLRFTRDGRPTDSATFMFYRGLHLYKGRVSAAAGALPADSFERFANHAMTRIVPAVQVRNTGGCDQTSITIDSQAGEEQQQEQLMRGIIESARRNEDEKCKPVLDKSVPAGHRAIELVYPASMWN